MLTRKDAQQAGLPIYKMAVACEYGHYGTRWTTSAQCTRCFPHLTAASIDLVRLIRSDKELLTKIINAINNGIWGSKRLPAQFTAEDMLRAKVHIGNLYNVLPGWNPDLDN